MTKTEIFDKYAIEQGYESWDNLVNEKINEQRLSLYYDFNNVTDLIQEELKKKIAKNKYPFTQSILNTENIK